MIKIIAALAILCALPVPTALLLKIADRKIGFGCSYASGVVLHLTIFALYIKGMLEEMAAPDMRPVKAILFMVLGEAAVLAVVVAVKCCKAKKWPGLRQLFGSEAVDNARNDSNRTGMALYILAGIIWILGAFSYLRYVPDNAVTMMADINRLDFFGVTNGDTMVMLGYYMKKLLGISQADAVCIVIPVFFYAAFVFLMWEMAKVFFSEDPLKRSLCFLTQGILLVAGDCLYTQSHIVLHGLNHLENILLALCVPLAFIIGLQLYLSGRKIVDTESRSLSMPSCLLGLAICMICAYLLDQRVFALTGLNAVIFILLFIGRRYLPWLQSSKS
ncbi:MAG: hypothetical protein HDR00_01725 [Lachnospiraceae bacterium]|nr:hypothetical protein [Lachnospiraceae bacterium]